MRLRSFRTEESVYVSLSDLLLTTVAIFFLLMIMFMSQVRPDQREEVARLKEEVTRKDEAMAKANDAVAKHPLELVIAIDVSSSMAVPLRELDKAIRNLAFEIPQIVDFRIGVVAFGGEGNSRVFALQEVSRSSGSSLQQLNAYLDAFDVNAAEPKLMGGLVDVVKATSEAVAMFSDSTARKVLVLIGDRGPYELHSGTPLYDYSDGVNHQTAKINRNYEREVHRHLEAFLGRFESASVMAMFTGGHQAGGELPIVHQSEIFFRDLAERAKTKNGRGRYSDKPAEMLSMLLLAMLASDKS